MRAFDAQAHTRFTGTYLIATTAQPPTLKKGQQRTRLLHIHQRLRHATNGTAA
jgi:hypothetical protein